MGANYPTWRSLKLEPGEIAIPSTDEGLGKGEEHNKQARRYRVKARLNPGAQHVGKRDAKRCPKHQVRNDPKDGQKNSETEKKEGQREPLDAADIVGDLRLGGWINRLEKAFAENPVVDNRAIDEPTEARGTINLSAPLGRSGWTEEN